VSPDDVLSPDKERQVLNGAASVFARDGYEGASMSRIAAEAGVSKGTLYNYFAGKAELFSAYVHRECSGTISLMIDDLARDETPEATLRRIGRRVIEVLLSAEGLAMYRMVIAEAEKFPELAATFYAAGPARAIRHLSDWIRDMCRQGRLRVDDPDFAAEQIFGLLQTKLSFQRRLGIIEGATDAEIDRVVDGTVHVFMRAYGVYGEAETRG
jgi:AcrR family transcriptional regulator